MQLPVHGGHTGGALQMHGPDKSHFAWDTAEGSSSAIKFCAFYADVGQCLRALPTSCILPDLGLML